MRSLEPRRVSGTGVNGATGAMGQPTTPAVKVQKMMPEDDPEALLNAFKRTAMAVGWAQTQWVAMLILCLIGLVQQEVDTVPEADLNDYTKVCAAILQTLNLSPEAYRPRLHKTEFGPDYRPRVIGQKIRAAGLQWLCLDIQTKEQIVKPILVEHYTVISPFKPQNWVLCHQPTTLEDVVTLMEAYASMENGMYLIHKRKKKPRGPYKGEGQEAQVGAPRGECAWVPPPPRIRKEAKRKCHHHCTWRTLGPRVSLLSVLPVAIRGTSKGSVTIRIVPGSGGMYVRQ